mgnify:CR=1 FL=1
MSMITMLFACKNEMSEVVAINIVDSLPDVTANDVEFTYSDSARVQVRLKSPHMQSWESEDEPYTLFPQGFQVDFFDSLLNITTTITAEYGIHYSKKGIMEALNNVVVTNFETGERLNTEELIWDEKKKLIYSNKFVKITSEDGVIYGDGLEADQDFSKRKIINPSGEIEVKEEEN